MNIYINCTHTYHSGINTGIQRVVRNVLNQVKTIKHQEEIKIFPVILNKGAYICIENLPELNSHQQKNSFKNHLKEFYIRIRNSLHFMPFLQKLLYSHSLIVFLNKLYDVVLLNSYRKIDGTRVDFQKGDVLFLVDAAWYENNFKQLEQLKQDGVIIITLLYDLIPITHSQYCGDDLARVFKRWFEKIAPLSDGFISISKAVQEDLIQYLHTQKLCDFTKVQFGYFYLGADFKKSRFNPSDQTEKSKAIFDKNDTFITIGTLEPRKNHSYILDAFEVLWEQGYQYKYVIIGRIGWRVESLLKRIKTHKEFGQRLFLLDNLDDDGLKFAYANSKAMIFASHAEGFGLPIVESLYYGLPVLVSSIPVHKEVGSDMVYYFDLTKSDSLVELIKNDLLISVSDNFKWTSWRQSTQNLLNKVIIMANVHVNSPKKISNDK